MSELDLARLDALATDFIRKNPNNELASWFDDYNAIQRCRTILEQPEISWDLACFALQVMKKHITTIFDFWTTEDQLNFGQWYDSLIEKHAGLLWPEDDTTPLCGYYVKLAGMVFGKGWAIDQRFQGGLAGRMDAGFNYVVCAVLGEIANEMARLRNTDFGEIMMAKCLEYCFGALAAAPGPRASETALIAIRTILEYEETMNSWKREFPNLTYRFSPDVLRVCLNPDTIQLLFDVTTGLQTCEGFKILVILASIDTGASNIREIYPTVLGIMMTNLTTREFNLDSPLFHEWTRLTVMIKKSFDKLKDPYPMAAFAQYMIPITIHKLTALSIHNDELNGITNLMIFWGTFKNFIPMEDDPETQCIQQARFQVATKFIECFLHIFDASESDIQFIRDFFEMDDTSSLHVAFESLCDIVAVNGMAQFTNDIFLRIFNHVMSTPSENVPAAKISFLCNCALGLTSTWANIWKQKGFAGEDFDQCILFPIKNVLGNLIFNVFQKFASAEYISMSFITFVRHFYKYRGLLLDPSTSRVKFYKEFGDITCPEIMFDRLFKTLCQIMSEVENEGVLFAATLGFNHLLEGDPKHNDQRLVMGISFIQQFVKNCIESPFPFLMSPAMMKCRRSLREAMCNILIYPNAVHQTREYLANYDHMLESQNPMDIIGFMVDFTAYFRKVGSLPKSDLLNKQFLIFFNYLFPQPGRGINHLQNLVELTKTVPNFEIACQIAKMWATMICNDKDQIQFKHHSPLPVVLLHITVDLLEAFTDLIARKTDEEDDIFASFAKHCFRIICNILNASYIPFEVFPVVGDTSVLRLVDFYRRLACVMPPDKIIGYPKLMQIIVNVNTIIMKKHINSADVVGVECLEIIMNIMIAGMRSLDNNTRRLAMDALEHIVCNNFVVLTKLPREKFVEAAYCLWDLCFSAWIKNPDHTNMQKCLTSVIVHDKAILDEACARIMEGVNEAKADRLREAHGKLMELMPQVWQHPENATKVLGEFVREARSCVKMPHAIFHNIHV